MTFSNDHGEADEELLRLLQLHAAEPSRYPRQAVLEGLRGQRLLLPVVDTGAGELQGVVFTSADGRQGLPAFTSLQSLSEWDPQARPLPQLVGFLARHCLKEGLSALLVDMASPHRFAVQGIELAVVAAEPPVEPAS